MIHRDYCNSTMLTSTKRLVAVGRMSPQRTELSYVHDGQVQTLDFVAPSYVGEMDAHEGLACDPTRWGYRTVANCEAYIVAYRDAKAAQAELDDLRDGMADVEFWRGGC